MVHSIHVSRHTVYWVQAQVGFGRVYFPGPNRVGARAHFMRWAQPILRLSRRACARANDGLACVNAGQPLMKNLSHFVKSVLYSQHCQPVPPPVDKLPIEKKHARYQCNVCTPSSDCLVVYNQFVTLKKCMAATANKFSGHVRKI